MSSKFAVEFFTLVLLLRISYFESPGSKILFKDEVPVQRFFFAVFINPTGENSGQ